MYVCLEPCQLVFSLDFISSAYLCPFLVPVDSINICHGPGQGIGPLHHICGTPDCHHHGHRPPICENYQCDSTGSCAWKTKEECNGDARCIENASHISGSESSSASSSSSSSSYSYNANGESSSSANSESYTTTTTGESSNSGNDGSAGSGTNGGSARSGNSLATSVFNPVMYAAGTAALLGVLFAVVYRRKVREHCTSKTAMVVKVQILFSQQSLVSFTCYFRGKERKIWQ
jgi:hypothetical protein